MLDKIRDFLFGASFSKVSNSFIANDKLFKLNFDDNWIYTKKGNSFYSFHNTINDFKGGLQFSLTWPSILTNNQSVLDLIEKEENGLVNSNTVQISAYQSIHYFKKYHDSNMDFFYWWIYHEEIMLIITHMIYEKEPEKLKELWLARTNKILNSLEMNISKFKTTKMSV